MAVGLGMSIGTVNAVTALAAEGVSKAPPKRRRADCAPATTRRTTLSFDSTGLARVGVIPRHGRAITEFADLSQRTAMRARVGRRALSPADLVAVVAECMITEARRDSRAVGAEIALTHPVGYTDDQVADLRTALDAIDLHHVALIAEPIAAATWLAAAHGPLMPGLALVYDLGGTSLDVTLVRVGMGCPHNPIVGVPLRSADFGGRAFGALVAARAGRDMLATSMSGTAADELRAEHVRASVELVYRCLRLADVTMADVDYVLVAGGAARPAEVAAVLADELARPVVIAPDPERTIADGAAILARRAGVTAEEFAARQHRRKRGVRRRVARALVRSRRARRRLTRVAVAAGMSVGGIVLVLALPADGVITGLPQLGLH